MEFAPRELCEKLVKMGCKSESGFHWIVDKPVYGVGLHEITIGKLVPAFFQNDFTGATELARANAKIVWGEEATLSIMFPDRKIDNWYVRRHGMIERGPETTVPEETCWQYLERTMKKP